ncbi:hypothetical protein [Rhizobium cremeum]|uniref:hypothetical protein n=1 Tax=Rhizobium cremeum TaxID=2813827 RepID=UPI0013AFB092
MHFLAGNRPARPQGKPAIVACKRPTIEWISFFCCFSAPYRKRQFFDKTLLTGQKSGSISRLTEREGGGAAGDEVLRSKEIIEIGWNAD